MFTILGADGREYGPATPEQIRAWMAAGRANLDTKAKVAGSDEWRRLADFSEFGGTDTVPPVVAVVDGELAERENRLFARLIDWSIRVLATLPGTLLIGVEAARAIWLGMLTGKFDFELFGAPRVIAGAWVVLISMLILFVVQVFLLSTRGQTIGKLVIGVRIVRFADGSKAGFGRAWFLRELVPDLLGFVPFIGPLMLSPLFTIVDWSFIFRDDRRCIHDFIAGTKVVKVAPRGADATKAG